MYSSEIFQVAFLKLFMLLFVNPPGRDCINKATKLMAYRSFPITDKQFHQLNFLAEREDGSGRELNSCSGLAGKGGVWEEGRAPLRCPQPGSPATEDSVCQALPWSSPAAPPFYTGGGGERASGPAHEFLQHPPCLGETASHLRSFLYSDECQKGTPPFISQS